MEGSPALPAGQGGKAQTEGRNFAGKTETEYKMVLPMIVGRPPVVSCSLAAALQAWKSKLS